MCPSPRPEVTFPPLHLRAFAAVADGAVSHRTDHGRVKLGVPKLLTDGLDLDGVHVDHFRRFGDERTVCGIITGLPISETPRFASTCVVCMAMAHAHGIPLDANGRLV